MWDPKRQASPCLKVKGGGLVGGLQDFSVSPRPLGFGSGTKGFGAKGLGPGLDNYGIRISIKNIPQPTFILTS